MKSFDAWSRNLTDQLREKEQTQEIKPEDLYTHKDMMRGEGMFSPDYNPKTVKVSEELEKVPLFVLGHNCTSTETVRSISSTPDIDYNGALPKNGKVCCTKNVLGETLLLIWAATGDQYVITDVVGELVELTEVNKNG